MVSTRGVKLKFFEGERVLCYEPDPTKAKVLYDSKVLDIIINKDHRGRKTVEYLIHFQGWNSSWDRCVGEEFVLKDTPENRQLQKDLAEKAQLQLGAYLYRRERKKHNRKLSERIAQSSEDGSSAGGSPVVMDTDDGHDQSTSSEEDSSADEDPIQIELTSDLKDWLESDHNLINTKNKLIKLPAEPNVITILENFWKHYVATQMCGLNEKPNTRYRQPCHNHTKLRPEDLQRNLNLCKEALDGVRIYFDFILNDLLLYKSEKCSLETGIAYYTSMLPSIKCESAVKIENDEIEFAHSSNTDVDYENCNNHQGNENNCSGKLVSRRRGLRSQRIVDANLNGNQAADTITTKPNINSISELPPSVVKELSWHLLPSYVYDLQPPPPSLIYGAIHLTRLFIKLPELLSATNIDENKLKVLLPYFESIIYYLSGHKEWFGEKNYVDT